MAVTWSWKSKIGSCVYVQHEIDNKYKNQKFKMNIYEANCLFAMIWEFKKDGKNMYQFQTFASDRTHFERCLKDKCYKDDWFYYTSWKLNTYYKQSIDIAKLLTKYGFKVQLYYKEPKLKKGGK